MNQTNRLKVLLPVYDNGRDAYDRVFKEIRKAGCNFSMLVDWDHYELGASGTGELPARNRLWKMALAQDDWDYCVTLSNDLFELPQNWGLSFVTHIGELLSQGLKVGALNAYGFVNTFEGKPWAQWLIDERGNNCQVVTPGDEPLSSMMSVTPPNPELGTGCAMISRDCLEDVGLFDTGFGRGGGMEHWDYVIRMYQKGWENLLTYRVQVKADIAQGNRFPPYDTYTYYHKKWGYGFDGIPTSEFVNKARYSVVNR